MTGKLFVMTLNFAAPSCRYIFFNVRFSCSSILEINSQRFSFMSFPTKGDHSSLSSRDKKNSFDAMNSFLWKFAFYPDSIFLSTFSHLYLIFIYIFIRRLLRLKAGLRLDHSSLGKTFKAHSSTLFTFVWQKSVRFIRRPWKVCAFRKRRINSQKKRFMN